MEKVIEFEKQQKAGFNSKGNYQFGSNCCIGCKVDRPLDAIGEWCEGCKNYQNARGVDIK